MPGKQAIAPAEVLARNVRTFRASLGLRQSDVADRMQRLQYDWTDSIVGFVERNDRNVTVAELHGLALIFGVTIADLLDPTGPGENHADPVDYGLPEPFKAAKAREWIYGRLRIRANWDKAGKLHYTFAGPSLVHTILSELDESE